jgi:hypothetical protein
MYSFDAVLIAFTKDNLYTILLVLGMLKTLAKRSPTTLDDEIVSYLLGVFTKEKK